MLDLSGETFIIAPGRPNFFIPGGLFSGGHGYAGTVLRQLGAQIEALNSFELVAHEWIHEPLFSIPACGYPPNECRDYVRRFKERCTSGGDVDNPH